ncbi:MAG: AmmeMemoRadiSam system protein A [Halanaeroarchaeum sp.]
MAANDETIRDMNAVDARDGERAVRYAQTVLSATVGTGSIPDPPEDAGALSGERGAFVTLEKDESLRGCIGRPYPRQPAVEAVRQATIDAATTDPRFPAVSPPELNEISIEVSLLTRPVPVSGSGEGVPESISVGRDGLIVRSDGKSGLLLPQVPGDHGWDVETFLTQTCRKAGLPGDCWRDESSSVERFRAQVFAETRPNGPIEAIRPTGRTENVGPNESFDIGEGDLAPEP